MEEKILELDVDYTYDEDICEDTRQQIVDKDNEIYFSVNNLCDCPEDAIIGRDLFDATDYINTLNKGIELAQKGYSKVIAKRYCDVEEE